MEIQTVGELLHWSYANLAMAHSAITAKAEKYGRTQFMIRSRLYAGLTTPERIAISSHHAAEIKEKQSCTHATPRPS